MNVTDILYRLAVLSVLTALAIYSWSSKAIACDRVEVRDEPYGAVTIIYDTNDRQDEKWYLGDCQCQGPKTPVFISDSPINADFEVNIVSSRYGADRKLCTR